MSRAVTWEEMVARSASTLATSRLGRLRANPEVARAAKTTAEENMRTIFEVGGLSEKELSKFNDLVSWLVNGDHCSRFI